MSNSSSDKKVTILQSSNWPTGTLVLLFACAAFYAMIALGRLPNAMDYVVSFGAEIQLLQCVTSLFIHLGNPIQLTVCLVFLFAFGSLVESRVGSTWTIGLFLGLGFLGQCLAQMALLNSAPDDVSLGAAPAISGLAGLLIFWSPKLRVNHFSKIKLKRIHLPIWALVAAWFATDLLLYLVILGFGPPTLVPHFLSFLLGLSIGMILLKNQVLKSDQHDLLNVLRGTAPGGKKEKLLQAEREQELLEKQRQAERHVATAQAQLDEFLLAGHLAAALALLSKMAEAGTELQISRTQLLAIIRGFHKKNQWEESIPWLRQYLEKNPDDVAMRLKLAQIYIVQQRLPGSAMEILSPLQGLQLQEAEAKLYRKLEQAADAMWEDDDVQLEVQKRTW